DVLGKEEEVAGGSWPFLAQTPGNDKGREQRDQAGDGEGPGRAQAIPAVAGIERAECAAGAGQRRVQGLALALLARAEAALDEVDGGGMEAAEGRRMQQLREQQHRQVLGQTA